MRLWRRVGTIGSWTLCSRILGLVRDRLLAGAFGASTLLDSFLLAFALPNLLRNLFGEGALSAAFVPRYVHLREQDPEQAENFAGLVLTRLCALLGLLAALGMLAAAALAWWGVGDWRLVAALALPQLPYLIFICVAAVMAGALNGRRHFAVPAAAPVLLNLVLIALVLWRPDIRLLPYGVLAAGILQAGLHVVALARTGGMPRARWRSSPALVDLRAALLPTLVASSIYQVNALLDSVIAFALIADAGAVTVLYCGNRLLQFPMALIAHGTGTALYPELASAAGQGYAATGAVLRRGSGMLLVLLLPAAAGLALVAGPLVDSLYRTGSFGAEAAARTTLVTIIYAGALLPISFNKLLVRVFHAHRDQRTPMHVAVFGVGLNLILNLILVQTPLREAGLALATGLSAVVLSVIYGVLLWRRGMGPVLQVVSLPAPLVATAVMVLVVWAVLWVLASQTAPVQLLAAVASGALVYGLFMHRRLWRGRERAVNRADSDN